MNQFRTMIRNIFLMIRLVALRLLFLFLLLGGSAFVSNADEPLSNGIYRKAIRSVQMFRKGWDFSMPILELGQDQHLVLKFDEVSDHVSSFYYTISHCDANWYPSRIPVPEYMEGFNENPINDYASSINTTIRYTNYQLALPNEQVHFLVSGNYLLSVFEDGNRTEPVLTRRFYIVEPMTEVNGFVKKSMLEGFNGRDQEIDFSIDYSRLSISDPRTDVKAVILQNGRADNSLVNLKPTIVRDNLLIYELSRENIFPGGNEFRNFDTKDLRINGLGVSKVEFLEPLYHVTLRSDQSREIGDYLTESDLNGRYLIKNSRAADPDLESDYIIVNFSLSLREPIPGSEVYVFGGLSDWRCLPINKMSWNADLKKYELALPLKQGFYDYQYVVRSNGDKRIDNTALEGSHVDTENDYQIFVYYHSFASRYDKLVGFRTINTVKR